MDLSFIVLVLSTQSRQTIFMVVMDSNRRLTYD